MSSSGTGGTPTPDWFELSNVGDAAVDITGWKMDDNSFNSSFAVPLNGVTNIASGESVVFIEDATTNNVAAFKSFWGGMTNKQVGTYTGSGVGLSSSGDGVVVFDAAGTEINRVSFGAATTGSSFYWVYDSSGNVASATSGTLSSSGTLGAYTSTTNSTYTGTNTASPGTRATALALAFTSSGDKFAKTGTLYSYNVTYQKRLSTDPEPTLSAVTKPAWLSVSGTTVSGTPGTNNIATNQTVTLRLTSGTNTVDQTYAITVFAAQPQIILNEYNGVSGGKFLSGGAADSRLGRIDGNGGNWIELVVVGNGTLGSTVDMRGWKIQISDVGTGPRLADTLNLSSNSAWQSVPAGTILTFTEDNALAGGMDSSATVEDHLATSGWAWRNVWMGDTNLVGSINYANVSSGISTIGKDDTQVVVLNATNGVVFGPCGENVVKNPSVNSTSVFALQLDPSSGVVPNLTTVIGYENSFVGFEKSTFGRPNKLSGGGVQPFFGKQPPYFVALPENIVKAGTSLSSFVDFRQDQDHNLTLTIRSKGGAVAPSWVALTGASNYGATLEANPGANDAGIYALEFHLVDFSTGAETVEDFNLVVLPASSPVLVNEFNCVSSSNQLNKGVVDATTGDGLDSYFGTVNGNGGGWIEMVVVGSGSAGSTVDMRGWKIEIDDGASGAAFIPDDTIVLSQSSYWQNVPAGTILTFTDQNTAQGGLDTWINKKCLRSSAGYDWSNVFIFDPAYVDQTLSVLGGGLGISSSNAQVRIRKPDGTVVAGPVGEGIRPVSGVSNNQILEYVGDPAPSSSPLDTTVNSGGDTVSAFGNGNGSTFGEPNKRLSGTVSQNFSAYIVVNSAPVFTNQPTKYAVEGQAYSWTAATADAENNSVTLSKVSGPTWLSVSGKTLSGTPPQGSAGFYDVALAASDGTVSTPLQFRLTVCNDNPSMILNEYNAVDNSGASSKFLNGGDLLANGDGSTPVAVDTRFGRVAGNGGDWVEFVVTGNGSAGTTDLRGWTIEIDEGAGSGYFTAKVKIKLSTASYWAAVPNGTILTFTENNTAQGGMDTNLNGANNSTSSGWRWANVWVGDSTLISYTDEVTNGYTLLAGVVNGINIDDTETQFRVLNATGYPVFGPAGEGIAPVAKISNTDVLELEGNPTASVLPTDRSDDTVTPPKNGYDNSTKGSTFGAPNEWHFGPGGVLTIQDFTPYKSGAASTPYDATFSSWATAAGQGSITLTNDADGNGLTALLEYAYGAATPGSISRDLLPVVSTTNSGGTNQLVLTYFTRTNGVTLAPEMNTVLAVSGWGAGGVSDSLIATVTTNNTTLQQRRAIVPIDNLNAAKFLRLKASVP